ncbi:MAG: response regulator [Planctomycetes bacterium]|nr:response regulator [Planctomycetota bacterium]
MAARVLLIDDDPKIHKAVEHALAGLDLKLDHASDGRAALGMIGAEPVDLIITDLIMPVKDGLSFVQILRAQGFRMPMIVLSGYVTDDLRRELSYYSDVTIIPKPFRPDELHATVKLVLEPKRAEP